MTVRLLVGDCRAMLATLPDASAHMVCTSPPYYGLRAYGTNPQVWGGDPACGHEWQDGSYKRTQPTVSANTTLGGGHRATERERGGGLVSGAYCIRCAAWRGELGSEPTPEQFVANLVAVFRDLRRVLHPSGVCIVNLGDSYAGSGKGPTGHNGIQQAERRQGFIPGEGGQQGGARNRNGLMGVTGYKAKDLMQMPARVAMALQADGWYLRSVMPWLKRAAMPESVTDRPSNALEWLFLFSKAPRYFWDADAVRQTLRTDYSKIEAWSNSPGWSGHPGVHGEKGHPLPANPAGRTLRNTDPWFLSLDAAIADARADLARLEAMRATGGVLTDDDGLPLAVDVNPQGFNDWTPSVKRVRVTRDAASDGTIRTGSPDCPVHADRPAPAATTPCDGRTAESPSGRSTRSDGRPDQGRPSDSSSTDRPHDADSAGGSSGLPRRSHVRTATPHSSESHRTDHDPATSPPCTPSAESLSRTGDKSEVPADSDSVGRTYGNSTAGEADSGVRPSAQTPADSGDTDACTCTYEDLVTSSISHFATYPPALVAPFVKAGTRPGDCVLDPFAGSGTTLLVADRLGRDAVGIELSPEYARMAEARIAGDAPLWVDMAEVETTAGDYAPLGLFGEAAS